jgi:hypothetical protein
MRESSENTKSAHRTPGAPATFRRRPPFVLFVRCVTFAIPHFAAFVIQTLLCAAAVKPRTAER